MQLLHALWVKCWPCHATEGESLCWQHHSRTWELPCLSVCSFFCVNKQPTLWAHILPPLALPMSNIGASSTPVRLSSLTLIISSKPKKFGHSSNIVSDDQHVKRAYIGIKVKPIDDGGQGSNVNTGSAPPVTRCDTAPIKGGREWETSWISEVLRGTDMTLLPDTGTLAVAQFSTCPAQVQQWNSAPNQEQ